MSCCLQLSCTSRSSQFPVEGCWWGFFCRLHDEQSLFSGSWGECPSKRFSNRLGSIQLQNPVCICSPWSPNPQFCGKRCFRHHRSKTSTSSAPSSVVLEKRFNGMKLMTHSSSKVGQSGVKQPEMDVSENSGFPPKSSILIRFSIINHPCWGTIIFGNTKKKLYWNITKLPRFLENKRMVTPDC